MVRHAGLAVSGLLLCAASGAAGLAHELLWTRRLIDLLGASGESHARVFGGFFLGLALGGAASTILVPRVTRPWRAVAWCEFAVAMCALPVRFLPAWTPWLWPALGTARVVSWEGSLTKIVVSALVVVPPAFFMGLVLPLMAAAMLRDGRALGRAGIWLYGMNALGGVVGLVVAGFLAVQHWGTSDALTWAIGFNVCVGSAALGVDRAWRRQAAVPDAARADADACDGQRTPAGLLMLAFASGWGVLAFEMLALRMAMLLWPMSYYAPMGILATVILTLALAAFLIGWLNRREPGGIRRLTSALWLTGLLITLTPVGFLWVAGLSEVSRPSASLALFLGKLLVLSAVTLGPALLAAGTMFPLTMSLYAQQAHDHRGHRWGMLLAVNGLGGLLGAEMAYRLLLPALGIYQSVGAVGLVYGALALWQLPPGRSARQGIAWAAFGAALLVTTFWLPRLPTVGPQVTARARVVAHYSGREGTVAVLEELGGAHRSLLMSNQYTLGGTRARWCQERQAHLPLVLHPAPRDVAFIGIATGITPGAALQHAAVHDIAAIEISPVVTRAAREHFAEYNSGVLTDPRGRVIGEDGRTYLSAADQQFDVIAGDLFLPWNAGTGRLYSVEHFRDVRRALRPGGVFCQWLPMYQLTPDQFAVIAATFQHVFGPTHLFYNSFQEIMPSLALVGFRDAELDWSVVRRRCAEARNGSVLDPSVRHVDGVAMRYLGQPVAATDSSLPLNTLANMWLELHAARERVIAEPGQPQGNKYVVLGRWFTFLDTQLEALRQDTRTPPDVVALAQFGRMLTLAEQLPAAQFAQQLEELRRQVSAGWPPPLAQDTKADWRRWPAKQIPPAASLPVTDPNIPASPLGASPQGVPTREGP